MTFLIGTDEAGYGPNLGPLVISTSVWQVPGSPHAFAERLGEAVLRRPDPRSPEAMVIADSKELYSSRLGLAALERGVLASLGAIDVVPRDWETLWQRLAPAAARTLPWYRDYHAPLPLDAEARAVDTLADRFRDALEQADVRLVAIHSRAVFPDEFNRKCDACGSKGAALTEWSLSLVAEAMADLDDQPRYLVFDKHGGRNRYAGQLQAAWCADWIEVVRESRAESSYRLRDNGVKHDVHFRSGGEAFLPTALASMTSKYLRELAMRAFNAFWCERVADLRPTAGYPQDARRFKSAIAAAQAELEIPDDLLWRSR